MASRKLRGSYDVKSARLETYIITQEFESNNTSDPDGVVPADGITIARADTGDLTFTWDRESEKPLAIHFASLECVEDDPDLFAKVTGYTASTGVLTATLYTNSAGTIAAADTTDKTYRLFLVCTRSSHS